jgi:protein MpaA
VARVVVIGTSVLGRPIRATEIGNPDASFKVVVVGCIHGNESAGIAITSQLKGQRPFGTVDLWVIDDLNPDGVAAGTRQNAHGVDLNRNFPYRWQPLGRPGDVQYSGPSPLSEPESRAAVAFLAHVRPSVVVWFHQQSNLVDNSGGDPAIERRFAQTIGLAHRQLARYPGSATGWENHYDAASTAFVVELPAGRADAALIQRALNAILEIKPQL